MRILVFQDYLRCGGTERQSLFLAEYFKSQGHEVRLLTIRPGGVLAREARLRGVDCESLQVFDTKIDWLALGLRRGVRQFGPNVILCMGRVANAFGGYLQRHSPEVAVVGTARTGKVLPASNLRSFKQVRGVIVNTHWWERELAALGIPSERIQVIHNSCVLPKGANSGDPGALRASFGVCSNTCVYLNVASLRKGKRHSMLIRAVASLCRETSWALWIVGAGPELKACKQLAASFGVADRVHFFGYQGDTSIFYQAADVAVSASIEDSLPNFLVESQVCGLPVVACDYRGVRESFLPGESGYLVASDDAAAFSQCLSELRCNPVKSKDLGAYGKAWAAYAFAPEMKGQAHLDFFDKVLLYK